MFAKGPKILRRSSDLSSIRWWSHNQLLAGFLRRSQSQQCSAVVRRSRLYDLIRRRTCIPSSFTSDVPGSSPCCATHRLSAATTSNVEIPTVPSLSPTFIPRLLDSVEMPIFDCVLAFLGPHLQNETVYNRVARRVESISLKSAFHILPFSSSNIASFAFRYVW